MPSFLDRLKAKMTGSISAPVRKPEAVRKSRNTIRTNKWDEQVWREARRAEPIDKFVGELMNGDEHKGGDHKPFEMAPEVVHDLFMSVYKADPVLEHKRNVARESYPVRKIMEELLDSPQLKELQEFTAGDAVMSTIATDSMKQSVMDIIYRVPPPPPPPDPNGQQQQGGGGGGQGQPQPGGGGGQGGQQQQDQGQGGQGQQGGQGGEKGDQEKQEPQPPQPKQPKPEKPEPKDEDEESEDEADEQEPDEGEGEGEGQGDGDGEGQQPDPIDPDPGDTEGGHDQQGDGGIDEDGEQHFEPDDIDPDPGEAAWEEAYDEALDKMGMDFDIAAAIDKAKEEVEELDGLRRGVGLDDGTWQQMSPEQRLKLAERLRSKEMRQLADVIGRMRRFALGTRATRVTDVPHEAFDVEAGDKIQRLLKAQFGLLGHPDTEYEFYRRLADKELLQFKMRGSEDAGKGPIVTAIDKSGSMNGAPFHWAMGVAEALRRFAADDERDYYAMFFGSNNDRNRFDFPKGKGPWEKISAFLSVVANGGTQFDGVLTEALTKASTSFDGDGKGKADIVFITDGQANLSEQWISEFNAERQRVGVRVYSVFIGGGYDMRYSEGPIALLERLSDAVITVKDLNPESARKIFEKV